MQYHTTNDGVMPYAHIVEIGKDDIDSDDISALLEGVFHDIKDRCDEKHFADVVYQIMGAIPENELDETLKEYDEYVTLDCGYVIPGLIEFVRVAEIEDEEDVHEYTSATSGDYGPSSPWNAPGMSVSNFI